MEHVGKHVSKYFPGYGWFDGLVEEVVDVQGVLHARVGRISSSSSVDSSVLTHPSIRANREDFSSLFSPTRLSQVEYQDGDQEDITFDE